VSAGTFARLLARLFARVLANPLAVVGPRAIPPVDAPRASSPPAPRCRLLKRPGKRSHWARAKGGRERKRLCPPAAVGRPDPHRACPSRRHGDPRVRTPPLYVKGCWLHQTPMQPTHWTGASVPRCTAMPAPQSPWRQNHGPKPWSSRRAGSEAASWLPLHWGKGQALAGGVFSTLELRRAGPRYARRRRRPPVLRPAAGERSWARCQPAWVGRGHKSGQRAGLPANRI
jgi:hypothetical protein